MSGNAVAFEKLKIDKYSDKLILNMPSDCKDFESIVFQTKPTQHRYDFIFIFVFSLEEMKAELEKVINQSLLSASGYLYFAYPKKGNKKYEQFIDRDRIFPFLQVDEDGYALGSDLKFAKMVSLNEYFTIIGLRIVKAKPKKTSTQPSQCVDDYIGKIPELKHLLAHHQEVLDQYNALTFGYQKDWARHIFSARTEATKEKRLLEMSDILMEGYKSLNLYRQKKK